MSGGENISDILIILDTTTWLLMTVATALSFVVILLTWFLEITGASDLKLWCRVFFITTFPRKYKNDSKILKNKRKDLWKLWIKEILWWPARLLHTVTLCFYRFSGYLAVLFVNNYEFEIDVTCMTVWLRKYNKRSSAHGYNPS